MHARNITDGGWGILGERVRLQVFKGATMTMGRQRRLPARCDNVAVASPVFCRVGPVAAAIKEGGRIDTSKLHLEH